MSDTPAATEVKDRLKHAYQTVGIANLDAIAALDAAEEQAASLRDDILGWINLAALLSETVVEQEEQVKALRAALEAAQELEQAVGVHLTHLEEEGHKRIAFVALKLHDELRAALTPPPPTKERTP